MILLNFFILYFIIFFYFILYSVFFFYIIFFFFSLVFRVSLAKARSNRPFFSSARFHGIFGDDFCNAIPLPQSGDHHRKNVSTIFFVLYSILLYILYYLILAFRCFWS